jgi:hypothetical protein
VFILPGLRIGKGEGRVFWTRWKLGWVRGSGKGEEEELRKAAACRPG